MKEGFFEKLEKVLPKKYRWIAGHEGVRRYFTNTSWMFSGQILYLLLSFFIGAWIARYLGPTNYGALSYVLAFVGLFTFVSSLGIDGILRRELVDKPEKHEELMGTGFRLKLLGAGLAFLLVTIASFFFSQGNNLIQALIVLFALNFFLQTPFVINIFFYANVQAKKAVKAQLVAALISSALKIVLILAGKGIIWLIVIYVLDAVWQSLLLLYYYKKQNFHITKWRFDKLLAKSLWRDSWPLMLAAAAGYIYLRIDQVMVGQFMDETAVGLYAAGVKLTEVFYFIPGVITGSLFPAVVNARKAGRELYFKRLKNLYALLGVLAVLVALIISLLASPIIRLVFGAQYLASVPILQLYIWSSVGLFTGNAVITQLMTDNRTKAIFGVNLIAMIANVGLNIYLIPRIGLVGAALATLISYSLIPLWMLLYGWRKSRDLYKV